jgi:hypothetical protein
LGGVIHTARDLVHTRVDFFGYRGHLVAGNRIARTYWRCRLTWIPYLVYQPALSVVGMYQMTDAAFA